ncbi:LysR family transcriptional regulator [Thioclava sp. GXIMD4216]|uniref:LysR family transcriptional regulator n=1 Tax=Thioclava sp. GXIMD4216 TaxID=3131929 RepID=UPI0030D1618E
MLGSNLRHLRVFHAVAETGSVTRAAELCLVSQPAVTQAIAKLEAEAELPLFRRTSQGFFLTEAGALLARRGKRALDMLDGALNEIAPRLPLTATRAQLLALIATSEAQNFSLAARQLGIAQPTVHRAVTQLEREAGKALFQRSAFGIVPTRACAMLARIARLSFAELDQAVSELGDLVGREVGEITIGAMPLARSHPMPKVLARFREKRPNLRIRIIEGTYDELLGQLRRGDLDFLIGALRSPAPIEDVVQERVFDDDLVLLAGHHHPLLQRPLSLEVLRQQHWLVTRTGTPTRTQFDAMFHAAGLALPDSIIETGSVILMREMMEISEVLSCVSHLQARADIDRKLVAVLPFAVPHSTRAIGLTYRRDWMPTPAQSLIMEEIRQASAEAL